MAYSMVLHFKRPLVTARQLGGLLAVSEHLVSRLAREGRIPFVMVGGCRRFDPEAVDAALKAQEQHENTGRGGD